MLYGHSIVSQTLMTYAGFIRLCPFFLLLLDATVPYNHLYLQRTEHDAIGFEEKWHQMIGQKCEKKKMFVQMSIRRSENDKLAMIIIIFQTFLFNVILFQI